MPGSTPLLDIPYSDDFDPRALWPTTSAQLAERLEDLLASYAAAGSVVGGVVGTPGGFQTVTMSPTIEPGQPWSYSGGVFTYSGPNRRFLVTVQAELSNGSGFRSVVGLGSVPGAWDRTTTMDTGPGPDGQAVHSHHLSMVVMMGPDFITQLVAGITADVPAPFDARLEVASL